MFVTNDVALITFVPLALMLLMRAGMQAQACLTVTLMTVAANLGSMLTPIGNPQNLYLYTRYALPIGQFIVLMLPYTALSALLLGAGCFLIPRRRLEAASPAESATLHTGRLVLYAALFVLCLLSVLRVLPVGIPLAVTAAAVFVDKRALLLRADYCLLLTFAALFIFIGNVGRCPAVHDLIARLIVGHELLVTIAASQIISNVPAALLLSGFTHESSALIVGTNLGGLGTLIASMASLISYKQLAAGLPERRSRYLLVFTCVNLALLLPLYALALLLR